MTAVKSALFMAAVSIVSGQLVPLSPCPKVFTYDNDGQQWHGTIKASSPHYEKQMKLQVSLSLGAKLPTNYSGSIELIGDRGRILVNLLSGLPITYNVNFPLLNPLPKITKISMNGRVICTGPSETPREGVKFVTDIKLEHVLQTGDGPAEPDETTQKFVPNNDYIPNPENFAQPRPPKPRPDDQQNTVSEISNQDDDSYFSNVFPNTQIYQKPVQQKPPDQGNHYSPAASQKPRPPKPPKNNPPQESYYGFNPNNVPVTSDNILNPLPLPPPIKPIIINVHGQPQKVVNYQVTQDRNVTKSETFHGTPENNQSSFNYHYYEVNKTETVVNRFSYEWANSNPGVPVDQNIHIPQQPHWKGSQVQPQEMLEINQDGSQQMNQRNKREIHHTKTTKRNDLNSNHKQRSEAKSSNPVSRPKVVLKRFSQSKPATKPKSTSNARRPVPAQPKTNKSTKPRFSNSPSRMKSNEHNSVRRPAQKTMNKAQTQTRPFMTKRRLYAPLP